MTYAFADETVARSETPRMLLRSRAVLVLKSESMVAMLRLVQRDKYSMHWHQKPQTPTVVYAMPWGPLVCGWCTHHAQQLAEQ